MKIIINNVCSRCGYDLDERETCTTTTCENYQKALAWIPEGENAMNTTETAKTLRPISTIAADIKKEWSRMGSGVYFGAVPYLDAMASLQTSADNYGLDSATEILCRFMVNAHTFRGERARELKDELEQHLPIEYRRKASRAKKGGK